MSEEYGNDFVVLTDEEGNEAEYEHLGTIMVGEETYMAFISAIEDAEEFLEDNAELIILKSVTDPENGEEMLASIDDEDELDMVYNRFMEELDELFEEDEEGHEHHHHHDHDHDHDHGHDEELH